MKVEATEEFNLGSLSKHYYAGDVLEVSDSIAKELQDAGLVKEAGSDATLTPKPKPGQGRASKPAKGPTETKDEVVTTGPTETK